MAKVWLDAGGAIARPSHLSAAEFECLRLALSAEPGQILFCGWDEQGFRSIDPSQLRDALAAQAAAPATPVAAQSTAAPAPRGFRERARHLISELPGPLQSPALAFARAAKRIVDGPAPVRLAGEPAFGAADVFVSFSPALHGSAWAQLRAVRDRLGFRVLLPAAAVAPQGFSQLEQWAAKRLPAAASGGAQVLRVAVVMALQGAASFEDRLQHLYTGVLREGDMCIDIGAHTGRHALPMSCAVGAGRVNAFEPNPTVAQWLRARLGSLAVSNVAVNEVALSDESGSAEFVIAVDLPEESGLKERVYNGPTRVERVPVTLERLDNLALGDPRFIKLDTEGAEYKVLLGARETIARARPVVAFEFGLKSYGAYGVDPHDVFAYFDAFGYDVLSIYGERLAKDEFARASTVQDFWDYVACDRGEAVAVAAVLRSFGK